MVPRGNVLESRTCLCVLIVLQVILLAGGYQDQSTSRPNTLSDNADDIQRQLDNEARDRTKYGQPHTVWVFQFPSPRPKRHQGNTSEYASEREGVCSCPKNHCSCLKCACLDERVPTPDWSYRDQMRWPLTFSECGGRSQSPVDLPSDGLVKVRGKGRPLLFCNYDSMPETLTLRNDGVRMTVSGRWRQQHWPLVYGGAAHSRRYLFHSLTLHWPSEHSVGTLMFPLELQALHISADYASLHQALSAARSDPLALLGIVSIYQFANETHPGLKHLLSAASTCSSTSVNYTCSLGTVPLDAISPPLEQYACYHGSLTHPPCTETVLWLVRSRTLGVSREDCDEAQQIFNSDQNDKLLTRTPQPLNDRRLYLFH